MELEALSLPEDKPKRRNVDLEYIEHVSAKTLRLAGLDCWFEQDYANAIVFFTKALEKGHDDVVGVLDSRACAYLRNGQSKLAIKDGRSIIEHDRSNAKGYIRIAKILQHCDKLMLARDICLSGLRNVTDEKGREVLTEILAKVTAALKELAIVGDKDPLRLLPYEMVTKILSGFSHQEIVILLTVSRTWHRTLRDMPELWRHIDCRQGTKERKVNFKFLQKCAERSRNSIVSLRVGYLGERDGTKVFPMLFNRCKTIERVEVANTSKRCLSTLVPSAFGAPRLVELRVMSNLGADMAFRLMHGCRQLKMVMFLCLQTTVGELEESLPEPSPSLETVVMAMERAHRNVMASWTRMHDWLPLLSNLVSLTLVNVCLSPYVTRTVFAKFERLETLSLNLLACPEVPVLPESVRRLSFHKLKRAVQLVPLPAGTPPHRVSYLPLLESFSVIDCENSMRLPQYVDVQGVYPLLKTLCLTDCRESGWESRLGAFAPNLEVLLVNNNAAVEVAEVCRQIASMTGMKEFGCSGRQIYGAMLADMVNSDVCRMELFRIEELGQSLVSRETIDYAKGKGVRFDSVPIRYNAFGQVTTKELSEQSIKRYYYE